MKALKLIYVFLLLCTIVIICSATSPIGALAVGKDIPVKVNPNKKDSLGLKTPAVIPITAYAIPEAGVITISFVRNIGEVDVELIVLPESLCQILFQAKMVVRLYHSLATLVIIGYFLRQKMVVII